MGVLLKRIGVADLEAVAGVMNRSSAGQVFEFHLSMMDMLALAHFWNISYAHSWLAWIDDNPAGVLLSAVEPEDREAYTFYWGVDPPFQKRTVALRMVYAYFDQLRREGYRRTYADRTAGSPSAIFGKLGYRDTGDIADMTGGAALCSQGPPVRQGSVAELACGDHWTQRSHFLRRAAAMGVVAIARGGAAVALPQGSGTTLLWLHGDEPTVRGLLGWLAHNGFPPPYRAPYVETSRASLLEAAGFKAGHRSMAMVLDL